MSTSLLQWSEAHSVGVGQLDDDHRELVNLVSEAVGSIIGRNSAEYVASKIEAVLSHAQDHFAAEERLMEQTAYHSIERHTEEHRMLLDQFHKAIEKYSSGVIGAVDLCTYLVDWLQIHIARSDREFADHLRGSVTG